MSTLDRLLNEWRSERDDTTQEPGFEPDVQQQEQYEPGYWENPQTLSMHYQFLNNGVDYPWGDWLEPNLLNNAYDHVKKFNEAKPSWLDWEALPNSDPYAGILRSMAVPPPEEQYQSIVSRYPEVMDFLAPPEVEPIPELTTTQQQLTTGTSPSENVMMSPEMWNELPSFQRVMAGVMSSPILQGAATMLPFSLWALGGALVGGLAGGPAGALVGALAPLAMGAGLGVIGDPQSYEKLKGIGFSDEMVDKTQKIANSSLWLLNQPAEWLEKGIGATIQLAGEEDKDKLDRMLDNLPAVFGAGAGTYEAYSAQYPTIGNIPAGIEYLVDMVTQGETDIRFAERGEVWKIGEAEPVPVDVYGKAGLEMARNEILKGAAPIEVLQGMQEMYGFSGMFTDVMGQIFFDPLNILPIAERKTIGAYAKIADKPMLAKAVKAAKGRGGVETLRIYRSLLRYTGDVDSLSNALKKYAGLTPEGRFKELEPTEGPKGTWEYINTLDPSSQTDALATMGVDMAGLLTNMIDNVDDLDKLVEAWTILKPGEVAEAAKILKTPMAATLSPALKDYYAKIYDPMSTRWKGGDLHRVLLHQIADALDETPDSVLKRMRKSGEAEVIHAQLLEAAAKRGDDAVNALTGDTSFTPAGIKAMLGWFKENPHDFNQFKAQVISGLGDHVANWGIEQYGVKPSRASVRFFGGVMKSIQSIILLGLNPMYLVNNLVNNSVTAMHEGVFGYSSPAHIAEFYTEFGITPRRGDIGYGPAGEVAAITGPLREARRAEGLVQEAQDVASGISGKMPFLKGGGAAEVVASRNTTYKGIRQAWNRLWHSDNYAPIPSDVRGEIGDSAAQALITRIDRAKNTGEIDAISKTLGADPGVSAETHIPEIAKELGMSSSDVRTILGEFTDKINRSLDRGATMTDAVALVEADVKKWQAERLKNDLITRASEVPARVQEEGFAAALSILNDMVIGREDITMRHFAEWQRFYETVDAVKEMGGKGDMINAMFDGQFSRADGEWKAQYEWDDTAWQGILSKMGFDLDVHPDTRLEMTEQDFVDYHKTGVVPEGAYEKYSTREGMNWLRAEEYPDIHEVLDIDGKQVEIRKTTEDLSYVKHEKKTITNQRGEQIEIDDIARDDKGMALYLSDAEAKERGSALERTTYVAFENGEAIGYAADEFGATGVYVIDEFQGKGLGMRLLELYRSDPLMAKRKLGQSTWAGEKLMKAYHRRLIENATTQTDVRWFYEGTKEGNNIWSGYFEQSQAKRAEFQERMMVSEWDTKTFGDNYKALERELAAMYDVVAGKENELNIRKGDLFVKMFGEKFGVDKTAGAAEWWKGISDNAVKRQGFMRDFRAFLRGEPVGSLASPEVKAMVAGASPKQHRQLWPKFLAEVYLPHIMENNGINADGGWRMFNDIMGRSMGDIGDAEKAGYFQSMREAMDQFMPEEVAAVEVTPVVKDITKRLDTVNQQIDEKISALNKIGIGDEDAVRLVAPEGLLREENLLGSISDDFAPEQFMVLENELRQAYGKLESLRAVYYSKIGSEAPAPYDVARAFNTEPFDTAPPETAMPEVAPEVVPQVAPEAGMITHVRGDRARLTGATESVAGGEFHVAEMLEGSRKGDTELINLAPDVGGIGHYAEDGARIIAGEVAPEAVPAAAMPTRPVSNRTIALEPGTEMRYEFLFKVVELDSLIASHDTNLNINPDFPKELQPRVRDRKASELQIDEISRTLDPDALLIDTHRLDSGAMIIGSDNVVEAGNGRTIALKRARDGYPDMWEGYVQRLREELPNLGLDETALEGVENPVLVRERVTDVDRKEFTGMIDEQKTLEKSPYERALQDADKINDNVLSRLKVGETQSLDQALNSTPNRDFVRTFMEQFTTNQRGGLMDAAGLLNEAGLVRLKNALFAKTYPGDAGNRLLRTFSESVDPGIKNIEHAMYASLPEIAKLEAAIRSGNLPDNLSITDDVSKAIDVLAHLREDKVLVEDYIGQTDMFGKELDDFQTNLLEYFGTYSRSQAVMRHTLQEYARAALQQPAKAQALMFDTTRLAKGDIFHATIKDLRPESLPLFEDLPRQAAPGVGQELEEPIARGPEGVEGAEGVAGVGAAAGEVQPVVEAPPPIAAAGPRALGTLDSLGGPRYESQIYNEGHGWYVRPILDELVRQSILKGDAPGKADLSKLSPEAMTSMKKWLGEVKQDMTKTKMGAVQLGYHARDMSILNYNSRYGLDNVLGVGFPYHFWFTHSMMNWAIRALDRPAFLAWMGKLAKFSDKSKDERSNLPSRLQGRWGIPQAFLPDWAGGNTWVDPIGKFFPILEFMRPIERIAQSESRFTRQAEFAVMGWARDGQIEQADAELAMTSRDGPIWERAFTQAKLEEGGRDPFDYMSMFVSPALWLTIPAKIMQGKGEEISPLPPSRTIQALATATGIEPLRMLDVEAHIRKSVGINAFGEWGDYYVDRQLANIAAERPEATQEALLAMIDRSGPVYEEALQRVQFEMMLRNPGAAPIYAARTRQGLGDVLGSMVFGWLPAHLLPASELKQRGLKTQYDAAWEEYNKGNKQAITTFFDENPEYKARLALWDEPEERLRQFLISNVWDQWHTMPKLDQRAASEQLGPVFQDQFLSSETRDYDSLDVGTLAQWAKQMGGVVPEGIDIAQGELELPPKADSAMYQDYLAARDRAYPGIMNVQYSYFSAAPQTQDMILQNTPISDYWAWNDKYIATHPGLMPYVISEDSKLFGVDFNTANLVYQFKTARHEQWPDYYDMQDEYYDENTSQARKREIMQRLGKAYDWERETITQFPQILPYVRSAESIAKGYLKNDYESKIDWQAQFDMSKIEPAAVRQLNNYYRSDETLTSGAMIYLRQVWESEGKPSDSLMDWIESMRVQFVGAEL